MNYKNDFLNKFFQEHGYKTEVSFHLNEEKNDALAAVKVFFGDGATIVFRYLLNEREYETFFQYDLPKALSQKQEEAYYLRLGERCYMWDSIDVLGKYMSFDRRCSGDVYTTETLEKIVEIYQRGGKPIDVLCAVRDMLHAWDDACYDAELKRAKMDATVALGERNPAFCYDGELVRDLFARDTLGESVSDEWGVVTKPDTFGDDGKPVEGGLYDESIFGPMSEWVDASRKFADVPSWMPDPGVIPGNMGVLPLSAPIRAPFAPDSKCEWFHVNLLPVLPPVFRPMYSDGKGGGVVSYLAGIYNDIALANGALGAALALGDPQIIDMWTKRLQDCVDVLYNDYLTCADLDEPGAYGVLERALMPIGIVESPDEQMAILRRLQGKATRAKAKQHAVPLSVALGRAATFVGYQPAFTVGDAADFIDECYSCGEAIFNAFAADDSAAN